jgi:hypothetical protein
MNYSSHSIKGLPLLVFNNFFSNDACEKIMQELLFLNNCPDKLKKPEKTGSATKTDTETNEKTVLKKNKGVWLDHVYADRSFSDILRENRKVFSADIRKIAEESHAFFRYIEISKQDTTLMTYYDDLDYYDQHTDDATITVLSWFYKQPKMFLGGELVFEDGLTVNCEFNRLVMFPSILWHSVNPIILEENLKGNSNGRFALTQFIQIF